MVVILLPAQVDQAAETQLGMKVLALQELRDKEIKAGMVSPVVVAVAEVQAMWEQTAQPFWEGMVGLDLLIP